MQAYTWETVAAEQLTDSIKRRMIVGTKEMLVRWEFLEGAVAARHSHP
jgi:quercetin dioxygenase-like cupin family protein